MLSECSLLSNTKGIVYPVGHRSHQLMRMIADDLQTNIRSLYNYRSDDDAHPYGHIDLAPPLSE